MAGPSRGGILEEEDDEEACVFTGPAGPILEEVRVRMLEQDGFGSRVAGEPRTEVIYERLAEWLAEQAEQCDGRGTAAASSCPASWIEYVRQASESIERRCELLDERKQPRVARTFHSSGALLHVDLTDWRGRPRARLLYDHYTGDVAEVTLVTSSGEELRYTAETFEQLSGPGSSRGGGSGGGTVSLQLERTRQSCARLALDASSPKRQQAARRSVEALCTGVLLPRLERLMRREVEEGRQLVPASEDLLEMDTEQIVQLLDSA